MSFRLVITLVALWSAQPAATAGGDRPRLERPAYAVPPHPWSIQFGNHRAVIDVPGGGNAAFVRIPWRRRDSDPGSKRIIVADSATGTISRNLFRIRVAREYADIVFEPAGGKGTYYAYYLPYTVQMMWGWYEGGYLSPEAPPDPAWVNQHRLSPGMDGMNRPDLAVARVRTLEARTPFDSFFPMEVPATDQELDSLLLLNPGSFLVFPEDRRYPIRMKETLPLRWVDRGPSRVFHGSCSRNEYYAFQIGVFAPRRRLDSLVLDYPELCGPAGSILPDRMTCFNLGGVDARGKDFVKRVDVDSGTVQALWIGVDVAADIRPGTYEGFLVIRPRHLPPARVHVVLTVADTLLADRGDAEPWRHSRLRWLNSRAGSEDAVVPPYVPMGLADRTITMLGREFELGPDGLPAGISAGTNRILAAPMRLSARRGSADVSPGLPRLKITDWTAAHVSWVSRSRGDSLALAVRARAEFDGHIRYSATVTAMRDISLEDIRLEIPVGETVAEYFMGMGKEGCETPDRHDWKWSGPQDSYWIGNADAGLHCELRGGSYHGPMLNLYHPEPPRSWNNGGKGGFSLRRQPGFVLATASTGPTVLQKGDSVALEFALLITPVKPVNFAAQFRDRYYHAITPGPEDLAAGIRIMNVHHGNAVNPFINYPFLRVDTLRSFVDRWHRAGMKVKIYYTVRELTNAVTEIWALRSLGDEILAGGTGGGYPWLREHLGTGYTWAWYNPFEDSTADAAVVTSGESRWYNYYIEGLEWLVRNTAIDGLYLDDVTYDRQILQRMRRVMARARPGCMMDLHSNTGFSIGPVNQYAEFFPYVDKLWFGESFQYATMPPANWLVEVSGIPFGLTGDMLQSCGNAWKGMLYGMTVRHPWVTDGIRCDPRPIWRVWDSVGIDTLTVSGYWERDCPVRTDRENVKATIYHGSGSLLIAVASWEEDTVDVRVQIEFGRIGIDPGTFSFSIPSIADFQEAGHWSPETPLRVVPRRGVMILGKRRS